MKFNQVEGTGAWMARVGGPSARGVLGRFGAMVAELKRTGQVSQTAARSGEAFLRALRPFLVYHNVLTISCDSRNRCYVNGVVQAIDSRLEETIKGLLTDIDVPGITFSENWGENNIHDFVQVLANCWEGASASERLRRFTEQSQKISAPAKVVVWFGKAPQNATPNLSDRKLAMVHYSRLVALLDATEKIVLEGRSPDMFVGHIEETFRQIIGRMTSRYYELRLLALTCTEPETRSRQAYHGANVAIFSVLMGRLLGVTAVDLVSLGLAALQHDLGRMGQFHEPDADGTRESPASLKSHVFRGLTRALVAKDYTDSSLLRMIVNHEHHRLSDNYPEDELQQETSIFSEIVSVADAFDRLQSGSSWQDPIQPVEVIRRLEANSEQYRPAAVELLRDVVGVIPRGTLLRLKNGDYVVVVSGGARRSHRPLVRRLRDPQGQVDPHWTFMELDDPATEIEYEIDTWPTTEWRDAILT
ncbi:MAG: HD domain-containing protein [Planctomycetota bacterium]|nr:HD domain-containing protein [Planctomycetota bacterium]